SFKSKIFLANSEGFAEINPSFFKPESFSKFAWWHLFITGYRRKSSSKGCWKKQNQGQRSRFTVIFPLPIQRHSGMNYTWPFLLCRSSEEFIWPKKVLMRRLVYRISGWPDFGIISSRWKP